MLLTWLHFGKKSDEKPGVNLPMWQPKETRRLLIQFAQSFIEQAYTAGRINPAVSSTATCFAPKGRVRIEECKQRN